MKSKGKKTFKPNSKSKPARKKKQTKSQWLQTRALSLERMHRVNKIRDEIIDYKYPNKPGLAKKHGVSEKAIERDINFIKRDLEIDFNYKKNGYCPLKPVAKTKFGAVNITELTATLFIAQDADYFIGTCWGEAIQSLCKKAGESFPDYVNFRPEDWVSIVSVRKRGATKVEPKNLELLVKAIAENEILHVTYTNGEEEVSERDIEPLLIDRFKDNLYLIAFDHKRKKTLPFAAWRVKPIQRTGRHFERPPGFSRESYFKNSLGIHGAEGDKIHHVIIRFRKKVALKIWERDWPGLEKKVRLPDGSVELHFRLHGLVEVSRLILEWMPDVIAISPPELLALHAFNMKEGNEHLAKMMQEAGNGVGGTQ